MEIVLTLYNSLDSSYKQVYAQIHRIHVFLAPNSENEAQKFRKWRNQSFNVNN